LNHCPSKKQEQTGLRRGDLNTNFYHFVVRWRNMRNAVKGVEVGNMWSGELKFVRREAKELFVERFKASADWEVSLGFVEI